MKILEIATNTNTLIYEGAQDTGRPQRQKRSTTVVILKNLDSATITFGTKDSSGAFVAFPDGTITEGSVINNGSGMPLWVNTTGITSNAVEIGVSI